MAQRVGRGVALIFHDSGTRRGWVVSSTPRPHFIPGKDLVPILQEAGWTSGPVWTGGKPSSHRDSISDRPVRSSVAIPTELPGPPNLIYPSQKLVRFFGDSLIHWSAEYDAAMLIEARYSWLPSRIIRWLLNAETMNGRGSLIKWFPNCQIDYLTCQ